MLRAYKYELRPTEEQKAHLAKVFGSCRCIYNLALETKIAAYTAAKKNINCFELMKQLTDLKQDCPWLYEAPNGALQHSISHLDRAFTSFFKGRAEFPKFKRKHARQSYHVPIGLKVDHDKSRVFLPKVKWVSFFQDRAFSGTVRSGAVSMTATRRYFVSVLVETGTDAPKSKRVSAKTAVGLDVGLKHFVTLSDGSKVDNPKRLFHSLKRMRIEQRTLRRRHKKGKKYEAQSNGYKRQRLVVAKLHERISNQRKDFLHKTSTAIVKQYDTICTENLNISGMVQNKNLARSISDAGWGMFISFVRYKCEWSGKNFIQIGRFEPSSKTCSCGKVNTTLKLSDREWTCEHCNTTHDRDVLAANNIKTFGLRAQPIPANVVH